MTQEKHKTGGDSGLPEPLPRVYVILLNTKAGPAVREMLRREWNEQVAGSPISGIPLVILGPGVESVEVLP
jgi:hypothetical protein